MKGTPVFSRFVFRAEHGLAVFIFGTTLALFWPAQGFDYIGLDDNFYVPDNPMVAGGMRWEGVKQAFATVHEQWWLPLLWISYMADIEVFGPGPHGHHLANVLLHAANAALLFWALFRLTGSRWRSAFAAALFAWHPLRVESVAWITERKDVLSGLFFMGALLAYVRGVRRSAPMRLAPVAALMLLGSMAKSILVVLPFLLLLLDYWPLGRGGEPWGRGAWTRWRPLLSEKLLLFGLAGVFIGLTLATHGTTGENPPDTSFLNRLTLIAPNACIYLGKIFWPSQLTVIHSPHVPTPWLARALAPVALLGLTALVWRRRKQSPYLLVGWLWFLVALFPVVRGIRFDEQSAYSDRYTYLPGIGIGLMLAWTAGELRERWRGLRVPVVLACGGVLAACLYRTPAQLGWWRDSRTLFSRAIVLAPDAPIVHSCLGLALLDAGQAREGEAHLREALRLQPENSEFLSIWGMALLRLDCAEEALAAYDKAIGLHPRVARYHNNRGHALAKLGRADEARAAFGEALRLLPEFAQAHFNLGNLLMQTGRAREALPHYEAAARGRPDLALAWYNLGAAYARLGRPAEAVPCLERALRIDPNMADAEKALERARRWPF